MLPAHTNLFDPNSGPSKGKHYVLYSVYTSVSRYAFLLAECWVPAPTIFSYICCVYSTSHPHPHTQPE